MKMESAVPKDVSIEDLKKINIEEEKKLEKELKEGEYIIHVPIKVTIKNNKVYKVQDIPVNEIEDQE